MYALACMCGATKPALQLVLRFVIIVGWPTLCNTQLLTTAGLAAS